MSGEQHHYACCSIYLAFGRGLIFFAGNADFIALGHSWYRPNGQRHYDGCWCLCRQLPNFLFNSGLFSHIDNALFFMYVKLYIIKIASPFLICCYDFCISISSLEMAEILNGYISREPETGPLFTKRTDVSPQDLMNYRSNEIRL